MPNIRMKLGRLTTGATQARSALIPLMTKPAEHFHQDVARR